MTHKEADARWSLLHIDEKVYALNVVHAMQEQKKIDSMVECTCEPEVKYSRHIGRWCKYCRDKYYMAGHQ